MTKLSQRHVDTTEAKRLGVPSGWYGTKVNGTFVTGPHPTEEACLKEIARIGPIAQDQVI
jgi:hypothetical protein